MHEKRTRKKENIEKLELSSSSQCSPFLAATASITCPLWFFPPIPKKERTEWSPYIHPCPSIHSIPSPPMPSQIITSGSFLQRRQTPSPLPLPTLWPLSGLKPKIPRISAYFGAKKIKLFSDTLLTSASGPSSLKRCPVVAVVHLISVSTFSLSIGVVVVLT